MRLAGIASLIAAFSALAPSAAAQVCAPFDKLALDRLPARLAPADDFTIAEMWRRWSEAVDTDARRIMDGAGPRVRVQTQEVGDPRGFYEVLAWREGGGWAMKARSADWFDRLEKTPWRAVKVRAETAQELDGLFADPCLWAAPSFLSDQLPLADGKQTTSVDGPVTFLDVRSGERRWPGMQMSWRLGRPAILRSALLDAAFGHPRYEDRELAADVAG